MRDLETIIVLVLHLIQFHHRVDCVIESSLREIMWRKNFALINLSLNFCETTIYDKKVFLQNLIATLYEIIKDFLKFRSCSVLGE